MTPTTITTRPATDGSTSWTDYLDAFEAAAVNIRTSLIEGQTAEMPVFTLPEGTMPAGAARRRKSVEALLTEITALVGEPPRCDRRTAGLAAHDPCRTGRVPHRRSAGFEFDVTG